MKQVVIFCGGLGIRLQEETEFRPKPMVDTGVTTLKGHRLKMVEPYINGESFMVTYGDGVIDLNIKNLVVYHKAHKKIATFTGVHPVSRFATVNVDKRGKVSAWKEKRQIEEYVNAGFFVFNRQVFDYLKKNEELETGPMEKLTAQGQVAMYRHEGFWQCMDTFRDQQLLEKIWNSGKAPWKTW